MPLAALPSLPAVIAKLSHRPAIPFSLNLLYVLLAPFCPAPSAADPPPATWDAVETYYEPGTKAFWFTADDDEAAWAVILTHEIAPGLIKVHSALSDPSPDSTSREGLFQQIMSHLKETHAGKTTSFGGVPDGLQSTFDEFVEEPKGKPSRSFKVQKTLEVALRPGKVLDTTRFVADNLTRDEIPYALDTFKSSYKPEAFDKTVHFTSCIRDLSTPERNPVSWCLVYEDLSIAALCTLPGHRGASLAHHTVTHLASLLVTALRRMPAEIQLALPGDEVHPSTGNGPAWLVADWNEGNPLGQGFFTGEGFEKLEEGVRWSRGKL